jgi:hypothetical protein
VLVGCPLTQIQCLDFARSAAASAAKDARLAYRSANFRKNGQDLDFHWLLQNSSTIP